MNLTCEQLNPHACKTYMIGLEGSQDVMLIDPVIEHVNEYVELLKKRGLTLTIVVDTHTHADHISGGASLKDILGCEYAMHTNSPVKCATFRLVDGLEWKLFDQVPVNVLYSPGHTRDSISLVFPDRVFTGDALFLDDGGAGRADLPGGDPAAHWETLQKIWDLPEELVVYPAHDYRDRQPSSLKRQKETNPHLQKSQENQEAFVQYLEDLKLGPADWMKDVLKANYACARDPKAAWIPVDSPACEVKGTLDLGANEVEVGSIPAFILKQKLASETPPVLLDVREPAELRGPLGHLDGVVNMSVTKLSARLADLEQYKNREIIVVCRSGARAYTAAQILGMAGFEHVLVLEGGMIAWNAQ